MSDINVAAPRLQPVQPPARATESSPLPQPVASGSLEVSPAAADATALRFAKEAGGQVAKADEQGLRSLIAECATVASRSGLSASTRAAVHLAAAGAYGRLAELGIDKQENGSRSFKELSTAFRLAPQSPEVGISYGRTMLAFNRLNFIAKPFVEGHLGIRISSETVKALAELQKHPDDGMAQLVRQRLAKAAGDSRASQEADENLVRLKQQGKRVPDPSELEADARHGNPR